MRTPFGSILTPTPSMNARKMMSLRDLIPPQGVACALRACSFKAYCPTKSDEIIILESKEGVVLFIFYPGHASKSFILPRGQCNVFIHGMKKETTQKRRKSFVFSPSRLGVGVFCLESKNISFNTAAVSNMKEMNTLPKMRNPHLCNQRFKSVQDSCRVSWNTP